MRELSLDGAEITVLKAIASNTISGAELLEEVRDLDKYELIDTLNGLITQGLIECDLSSFYSEEELKRGNFSVNSGYSKEIKNVLHPREEPKKSRRIRRE